MPEHRSARRRGAHASAVQEGVATGVGPKRGTGHTLSHLIRVRVRVRGLGWEGKSQRVSSLG